MTSRLARLEKAPIGGGLASGLATAVCCGGLPLFASIGLGASFASLQLWRFILLFIIAGTLLIVAVNWAYYRRRARTVRKPAPLRRAMFVSAGIGLLIMVAGIWALDYWEAATEATLHETLGEELEEPSGVRTQALLGSLIALPAGLILLALLPFPRRQRMESSTAPGSSGRSGGKER